MTTARFVHNTFGFTMLCDGASCVGEINVWGHSKETRHVQVLRGFCRSATKTCLIVILDGSETVKRDEKGRLKGPLKGWAFIHSEPTARETEANSSQNKRKKNKNQARDRWCEVTRSENTPTKPMTTTTKGKSRGTIKNQTKNEKGRLLKTETKMDFWKGNEEKRKKQRRI